MFENGNLFSFFGGSQKTFEVKSPNGTIYRYSTNAMDDKTFHETEEKLKKAAATNDQQSFDLIWAEVTAEKTEQVNPLENELKKLQNGIGKLFGDGSPLFNGAFGTNPFPKNPFASKGLKVEDIDQMIAELQQVRNDLLSKVNREEVEENIAKLKTKLDDKLLTLSELADPEEKQALTDELAGIYKEIKELEKKLSE